MTEVYIFIDEDRGDYLVFSELRRAQNEGWPAEEDWIEEDDEWVRGESCKIILREVDEI